MKWRKCCRGRGRELTVEANEKAQFTAKLRGMAKVPVSKIEMHYGLMIITFLGFFY